MKSILPSLCCLIIFLYGCKNGQEVKQLPHFEHDIESGPTPWTRDTFELEEEDFTFAIIADLTGGEREGVYSAAVEQLNSLDPTFVVCVGDLIEGGTEDSQQLTTEWDSFDKRTSKLNMPFFYLGGNHDLTNPVMRTFWEQRYGRRYYHFVYEDVLFLMMDSEDYEEQRMEEIYEARANALKVIAGEIDGVYEETEYYLMKEREVGGMSNEQLTYFKEVLERYPNVKWTFVLMHKPLWKRDDKKGLAPLEALMNNRPYTVINGHEHSFSYHQRNQRDYMILGTTGGAQNKEDSMAFDHVSLVRMAKEPVITHLKMSGILDKTGKLPASSKFIN